MVEDEENPINGDEEENLRRAIDEISSLIALSHTIRVFSVKWQLIRAKLHELNTGLIAAETSHSDHLHDLVSSVFDTAVQCRDLAARCINVTYSGKLLMQSDLDLIISKLDAQSKKLSRIYSAVGVLSGGFALVVSKPGAGATREDMRFYVKDLLNRLKIGDSEMKRQALISLNEIVIQDEKYVRVVAEMDDFVIVLAGFLDSNDEAIQESAAAVVEVMSGIDCHRGVLVNSCVIGPLIRVIECGSLRAKASAINGLRRLTENGDNAWALSAHGGVTALLNVCSGDDCRSELTGPACCVLRNVVGVDEIKRFMIEEGAIPTLIELIKGRGDETAQVGSTELLQAMAAGDDYVRDSIVKEGGARALVRILDPKSSAVVSFKLKETALRAIENLCFSCVDYVNLLIVSFGFMDYILYYLRKGDVSIQELAFKSASRLCGTSEDARKAMGEVGFMVEFVKFLEAKSYEIRELAAEALSIMVTLPRNRKKFAQDDYNIVVVLQLLDPKQGNSGNFKFLLSILLSLSSCNHARRKIASSGYVKNIEKLADAGVSDAKKILRKLSTNKFKTMLNGILHLERK